MKPSISIIVPCYNVEKYIDKCIDSIVNQTIGFSNIELILVNDASVDSTYNKLLEWEQRYPDNIMVISYEENLKQGGARNVGISYAGSDYIGFVDADDWIAADMYETLYKEMTEGDYDAVYCKIVRTNDDGKAVSEPCMAALSRGFIKNLLLWITRYGFRSMLHMRIIIGFVCSRFMQKRVCNWIM